MRFQFIAALSIGLASLPAPGQARDLLRLAPSGPWALDYAADSCRLARTFGEGEQRVTLFLDQFDPGDDFRIKLAGEPLRVRGFSPTEATIRFGPNEAASDIEAMLGKMDDDVPAWIVHGSQRIAPLTEQQEKAREAANQDGRPRFAGPIGEAREKAAIWLEISGDIERKVRLDTGPMAKPLAALRKCSWETVAAWGLDVEQQRTLTRRPVPTRSPSRWMTPRDYPREMLRHGYTGLVNVRMIIDASGEPTSCDLQMSTQPEEFDEAVCDALMKRAHFRPALDAQGRPVPSYWQQTVTFKIR